MRVAAGMTDNDLCIGDIVMNHARQWHHRAAPMVLVGLLLLMLTPLAGARNAALGPAGNSITPLLGKMVGTWHVDARMWTGPDSQSITIPAAVAHRRLVGGAFLEEVMQPVASGQAGFTRIAYVNYNPMSKRYEYFSLDTRAPQQMHYRSGPRDRQQAGPVKLRGGVFVARKWGPATHVTFRYRLVLGAVHDGRQVVRLYLTPLHGDDPQEFLAFKYVYTRQG